MGYPGARRSSADVSDRRRISLLEEEAVAIYIRVIINSHPSKYARTRYILETMLSTLGLSFELISTLKEIEGDEPRRYVYLVVGLPENGVMDHLAQETAVFVIPEPDLGTLPGDCQSSDFHLLQTVVDPTQLTILSHPTSRGCLVGIRDDILGPTFRLLSRYEEHVVSDRDKHDRFLWAHSPLRGSIAPTNPLVSRYAHLLLDCLQNGCLQAGLPMVRKEFWPFGKSVAGCLSHDVDVVRRGKLPRGVAVRDVTGVLSSLGRGALVKAGRQVASIVKTAISNQDPYWTFDRISAMEREKDYRSTYFFMAESLHPEDVDYELKSPKIAQLMSELVEQGCEIGLHGSYETHSDPDSLHRHKKLLEEQLGREVVGHRNHLLRFRISESWKAQQSAGFSYDSTLGFADHEGFRGGSAFPFRPYDLSSDKCIDILEIPMTVMDVSLRKYRRLRGSAAEDALLSCLEETLAVHGLATLLWHNDTFYEAESPGFSQLYETALSWLSEKEAYVATCAEMERWWRAREAVRLIPLSDGRKGWCLESPCEIEGLVLRISLPDPQSLLRLRGEVSLSIKRDGQDHLMEFGSLPTGSSVDIEYS